MDVIWGFSCMYREGKENMMHRKYFLLVLFYFLSFILFELFNKMGGK